MSDMAVIFGGGGGIGSTVARIFAGQDLSVCVVGRNEERLKAVCAELPSASFQVADATNEERVKALFETLPDNVRVIVNCVGSLLLKPAHATSVTEFQNVINTNLLSAFLVIKYGVQKLPLGGAIILVSSCAARIGLANHEGIAAAKAGIEGLVRSAAMTYAAKGIRINAVAPGLTRTPLTARITSHAQSEAASLALHPLARLGEPEDIAQAIAYLASEQAAWVTGQILSVDGGLATLKK